MKGKVSSTRVDDSAPISRAGSCSQESSAILKVREVDVKRNEEANRRSREMSTRGRLARD